MERIGFEILSDEPWEGGSLSDMHYATSEGPCVGRFGDTTTEEIDGPAMAKALMDFGSDPSFFELDAKGNPLEDD